MAIVNNAARQENVFREKHGVFYKKQILGSMIVCTAQANYF